MNRIVQGARVSLFALAVCGALGFGASAAVADAAGAPPCPRTAIGRCTSLRQCQDLCAQHGGDVANARCETDGGVGCCFCPLLF
jgi:hypothetical protein